MPHQHTHLPTALISSLMDQLNNLLAAGLRQVARAAVFKDNLCEAYGCTYVNLMIAAVLIVLSIALSSCGKPAKVVEPLEKAADGGPITEEASADAGHACAT